MVEPRTMIRQSEMRLPLAQFDRRCERLPVELASVSVVSEWSVRAGLVGRRLAIVLLSAAALTLAGMRIGMTPSSSVIVSAALVGFMWSVATVVPGLFERDSSLWSFQADKTAADLLGVSVPSRRYGLRRTLMPYFKVRLGTAASALHVVDVDGRKTDLRTTGCRFELSCTSAGRIVDCEIVKGPERTRVDAQGRLSVATSLV